MTMLATTQSLGLDWGWLQHLSAYSVTWLATVLLHSTLLIGAVWLITRTRRLGAHTDDLLWKLALVAPLITASVQLGAGIHPLGGRLEVAQVAQATAHQDTAPLTNVERPMDDVESDRHHAVMVHTANGVVAMGSWTARVQAAPPASAIPAARAPASPATPWSLWWPVMACGLWWLVAAGLLCALVARYRRLHTFLAPRRLVEDDAVIEAMVELRGDKKVVVSHLERLASPVALGRGEICVPTRMLGVTSPTRWRAVLGHELMHLERADYHWLLLASVVEAMVFVQPLFRLARRGMVEAAEFICDDAAIDRAGRGAGASLAETLADLAAASAAGRGRSTPAPLPAMGASRGLLTARVERLLDETRAPERRLGAARRVGIVAIAVVAMLVVAPAVGAASPPASSDASGDSKAPESSERATASSTTDADTDGKVKRRQRARREKRAKRQRRAKRQKQDARRGAARDGRTVVIIENGGAIRVERGDGADDPRAHRRSRRREREDTNVDVHIDRADGSGAYLEFRDEDGDVTVLLPPGVEGVPAPPRPPLPSRAPGVVVVPPTPPSPPAAPVVLGGGGPQLVLPPMPSDLSDEATMRAWQSEVSARAEKFEAEIEAQIEGQVEPVSVDRIERQVEREAARIERALEQRERALERETEQLEARLERAQKAREQVERDRERAQRDRERAERERERERQSRRRGRGHDDD